MINYTKDGTLDTKCIDGYANGSISTKLYNPAIKEPYYTMKWDEYDLHNITIKEWTDHYNDVEGSEDKKSKKM